MLENYWLKPKITIALTILDELKFPQIFKQLSFWEFDFLAPKEQLYIGGCVVYITNDGTILYTQHWPQVVVDKAANFRLEFPPDLYKAIKNYE